MRPVIVFVAILAFIVALSMATSQGFGTQQTNIKTRTGFGMRRPINSSSFKSKNKEVTFGTDGNLVWYGAVDPNLLQVAGSGALY